MAAATREEEPNSDFVNDIVESLEARKPRNDIEKNAISVAKILTPILATTINKAVEPAVKGVQKMQAAIRKNSYELDRLQQYAVLDTPSFRPVAQKFNLGR